MNDNIFNKLLESTKEVDLIIQGTTLPSRITEFSEPKSKTERAEPSQRSLSNNQSK